MTDRPEPQSDADQNGPALNPADAAALEALFDAGLDRSRIPPAHADRARRAGEILDLLNTSTGPVDEALVDVTMARILRASRAQPEAELTPRDREALDAWVLAGYNSARVPTSLRQRAMRHHELSALVTSVDAAPAGDLVERTLAAVNQAREASGPYQFRGSWRSDFRMADLVSVAAMLLIAVSVIWPVMSNARSQATKFACADNLRTVASAMSQYAGSNRDQLPMATASLGGGRWWDVGSTSGSSNSSNLFTLARSGFASLASLACPGNPTACRGEPAPDAHDWRNLEEVSYSYQIMFGPSRRTLHGPDRVPVLADRSPVVLRAVRGEVIYPWENSPNHAARGQEILYSDGSARWYRTPALQNGDNIWLPRVIEEALRQVAISRGLKLQGTETPQGADDVFLGP